MKRLLILLPTYLVIAIYCEAGEIDPKAIYDKLDMKIYQDQGVDTDPMPELKRLEFRSIEMIVLTSELQRVSMGSNTNDPLSTKITIIDDAIFETPKLSLSSNAGSNQTSNTFTNSAKTAE